jgi:hypothetical protein
MSKFYAIIESVSQFAHQNGYYGFIGIDLLEDRAGALHLIDANIRVNGSTALCLQRHVLLGLGKEYAKYSSGYWSALSFEDTLQSIRNELDSKDFIILSALENQTSQGIRTDIYGIVASESLEEMQHIESRLKQKGLQMRE